MQGQTHTERFTDRQKDTRTKRKTHRQTERLTDKQKDSQTNRKTHRQTERLTDKQKDSQTDRLTYKQKDSQSWSTPVEYLVWGVCCCPCPSGHTSDLV
uniref:Uncharacterized protein n=1 Tax=Esox lucius TaxID=8010 RepID=A0AAY5JZQ2_ESOLU